MSNARIPLAFVGETMFPLSFCDRNLQEQIPVLQKDSLAPFFLKTWGNSRFPTPLHAHRQEAVL